MTSPHPSDRLDAAPATVPTSATPFPPPTGRPAATLPRPDPWVEQLRRREAHDAEQRRRRRKWWVPAVVCLLVLAVVLALLVARWVLRTADDSVDAQGTQAPVTTGAPSAPSAPEVTADRLIDVDRVWLIDRGDGVFDWGVTVDAPPGAATRSGVVVDVRLLDAGDEVVESASGRLDGVGPGSVGAVTGRLNGPGVAPVRLEYDISVGDESSDPAVSDVLAVRAIEREGDTLRGRIRVDAADPVENVTMVLLWFDDDGEVIASVPQAVDRVRPGVDARFEIDLSDEVVPDGRPDSVVWTT